MQFDVDVQRHRYFHKGTLREAADERLRTGRYAVPWLYPGHAVPYRTLPHRSGDPKPLVDTRS